MHFAGLKHQLVGGGRIDGSWGNEGIAPGNLVPQVAPDTVCKTRGNTAAGSVQESRQIPQVSWSSSFLKACSVAVGGVAIEAETRYGNYNTEL